MSDPDPPTLALPFDTDNRDFVRGVQIGSLWAQFNFNPEPFSVVVYAENAEMIARIVERADDRDHTVTFSEGGEWALIDVGAGEQR